MSLKLKLIPQIHPLGNSDSAQEFHSFASQDHLFYHGKVFGSLAHSALTQKSHVGHHLFIDTGASNNYVSSQFVDTIFQNGVPGLCPSNPVGRLRVPIKITVGNGEVIVATKFVTLLFNVNENDIDSVPFKADFVILDQIADDLQDKLILGIKLLSQLGYTVNKDGHFLNQIELKPLPIHKSLFPLDSAPSFIPYVLKVKDSYPFHKTIHPYQVPQDQLKTYLQESKDNGLLEEVADITVLDDRVIICPIFCTKTGRFVFDLRLLNHHLEFTNLAFSTRNDLYSKLLHQRYFSIIDLSKAFNLIPLIGVPLFVVNKLDGRIVYHRVRRLPFGMASSTSAFNVRLQDVLKDVKLVGGAELLSYIDDIIIASPTMADSETNLALLLAHLKKLSITINHSKLKKHLPSLDYLGYTIGHNSLKIPDSKLDAVKNLSCPTSVGEVQSVLGLFNFLRTFIQDYSTLALGMCSVLKKGTKFDALIVEDSFNKVKSAFLQAAKTILTPLDFDSTVYIYCDASQFATGSVSFQYSADGSLKLLGFDSQVLSPAATRYSSSERELVGVTHCLNANPGLELHGDIVVLTDHNALVDIQTKSTTSPRLLRLWQKIQHYSFKLKYVAGPLNISDALSRYASAPNQLLALGGIENVPSEDVVVSPMDFENVAAPASVDDVVAQAPVEDVVAQAPPENAVAQDVVDPPVQEEPVDDAQADVDVMVPPEDIRGLTDEMIRFLVEPNQTFDEDWLNFIHSHLLILDDKVLVRDSDLLLTYIDAAETSKKLKELHAAHHASPRILLSLFTNECRYFHPSAFLFSQYAAIDCDKCSHYKSWPTIFADLAPLKQFTIGHTIHIDHVELRFGSGDHKYLLTVAEASTGYLFTFPVMRISMDHTVNCILLVMQFFPNLTTIVADNHSVFSSAIWKKLLAGYEVKVVHSASYYPRSNGLIEIRNKLFKSILKDLSYKKVLSDISHNQFTSWSKTCLLATMLFNMRPNSFGYSPFFLLFGHKADSTHLQLHKITQESPTLSSPQFGITISPPPNAAAIPAVSAAQQQLNVIQEKEFFDARVHQIESHIKHRDANWSLRHKQRVLRKALTDRYSNKFEYALGELVMVKNVKKTKFDVFSNGPYLISKVLGKHTYEISTFSHRVLGTYDVNRLFPAYQVLGSPIRSYSDISKQIFLAEKQFVAHNLQPGQDD